MAQPGTDAQAMGRPVQPARVRAGESTTGCESTSNRPGASRERTAPQPAGAGVADPAKFLTFPIVAGSDVGERALQERGLRLRRLRFATRPLLLAPPPERLSPSEVVPI